MDEGGIDRAAILARRQRFVALALTGLAGVGSSCRTETTVEPPQPSAPRPALTPEPPACTPAPPDSEYPPLPEPQPAPPELDDEERDARAKALHQSGEELLSKKDWDGVIVAWEAAYYLVPERIGFAFEIARMAFEAKRYEKAEEYLEHFLVHALDPKYEQRRQEAMYLLDDVRRIRCEIHEAPMPIPDACLSICHGDCRSEKQRKQDERRERREQRKRNR